MGQALSDVKAHRELRNRDGGPDTGKREPGIGKTIVMPFTRLHSSKRPFS